MMRFLGITDRSGEPGGVSPRSLSMVAEYPGADASRLAGVELDLTLFRGTKGDTAYHCSTIVSAVSVWSNPAAV